MINRFRRPLATGLALLSICPAAGAADCDYAVARRLPEQLTLEQRSREAELEYERLALNCQGTDRSAALSAMIESALATRDYSFALNVARAWRPKLAPPDQCIVALGETRALYGLDNPEAVRRQTLPAECPPASQRELTYAQGLSDLRLHQWAPARNRFTALSAAEPEKAQRALNVTDKLQRTTWKSPGAAAAWSAVLPGSGYLYSRRPQTAAAALVLNGLLIGGTWSAAHHGQPALAALLGLFSAGWYFGGIRGSALAAERTNRFDMQQHLDPIDLLK